MSNALAGFQAQAYVCLTSGGTYGFIGELKDYTLTVERDTIDVSSHSSAGWKDNILGLAQWTATADYLYIHTDAQQDLVYDALVNRSLVYFKFRSKGESSVSGDEEFVGSGYITHWEMSTPNNDAQAAKLDILGAGALTRQALP